MTEQSEQPKESLGQALKAYLTSKEFFITLSAVAAGGLFLLLLVFFVFLPWITRHGEFVETPDVTFRPNQKKQLRMEEAEEMIRDAGLAAFISDSQYDPSFPPGTIIRQEPPGLDLVKPGRTVYLVVSKKDPPNIKTPNIIETNIDQARYLLENWGLKVGNIEYKPGNEAGLILRAFYKGKEIKPNDEIPKGAALDLHISKGPGFVRILVPDLVDKSFEEAVSILNNMGLGVGEIRYKTVSRNVEDGTVIDQFPKLGKQDSVNVGTTVDLILAGEKPTQVSEGKAGEGGSNEPPVKRKPARDKKKEEKKDGKPKKDKQKDTKRTDPNVENEN